MIDEVEKTRRLLRIEFDRFDQQRKDHLNRIGRVADTIHILLDNSAAERDRLHAEIKAAVTERQETQRQLATALREAKLLRDRLAGERRLREDIAAVKADLAAVCGELETAMRHKELFRRALFVYLQERDGPAGRNAPTPETLAEMRSLIERAA